MMMTSAAGLCLETCEWERIRVNGGDKSEKRWDHDSAADLSLAYI
jgi:hypothetical protein